MTTPQPPYDQDAEPTANPYSPPSEGNTELVQPPDKDGVPDSEAVDVGPAGDPPERP